MIQLCVLEWWYYGLVGQVLISVKDTHVPKISIKQDHLSQPSALYSAVHAPLPSQSGPIEMHATGVAVRTEIGPVAPGTLLTKN